MNCRRALALRQRNVQRVAKEVYRRVVSPIRSRQDVPQIGGAEVLDEGVVLDVNRVIHRQETQVKCAVVERQVCQQQTEQHNVCAHQGVGWEAGSAMRAGTTGLVSFDFLERLRFISPALTMPLPYPATPARATQRAGMSYIFIRYSTFFWSRLILHAVFHPLWDDKNCRVEHPVTGLPPSESRRAGLEQATGQFAPRLPGSGARVTAARHQQVG